MSAILDGVEYAHAQGVLHRDLNPRNVLMNSDSDVIISDFGLGRVVDSESTRRTQSGFGMGTMLYMAPEQMDDAKYADQRADIYSLGRMIYEMYTGPLKSLHQDVSRLPPGIAHIVTRSTQPNAELRFQILSDLKRASVDSGRGVQHGQVQ
jgi:serine/threonine protein kinase